MFGDADFTISPPFMGWYGVRVYGLLSDVRGGDSEAFPATHYWRGEGPVLFEKKVSADGSTVVSGEADNAGMVFVFRGGGCPVMPDIGQDDFAWIWTGDIDG